jgi:hypothetical protein
MDNEKKKLAGGTQMMSQSFSGKDPIMGQTDSFLKRKYNPKDIEE